MKLQRIKLFLLASMLLCLSGCMFRGADELFDIPRTSEINQRLQETVQEVIGTASGISPVSGNNTQTLQLVDLDHDGIQEAVAFYRDNAAEWPLKIAIFKQGEAGEYELYAQIEGAGTDIESIEYKNLVGGSELEILVSWQVSSTVHTLAVYSVGEKQVAELLRSGYTRHLAADFFGDGKSELLLVQTDSATPLANRVELYTDTGGALEFHSSAPLSDGILSLQVLELGYLKDKVPAFLVTSECGENKYVTDIFCIGDTGLGNITLDETSRVSTQTLRHHTGVLPDDINEDGMTEIPTTTVIQSYNKNGGAENFWKVNWMLFDQTGASTLAMATYHNNSDRWYLELPPQWAGLVTLRRLENASIGERAVVFSYWRGDPAVPPEPFLTIYRLTGNNRSGHASQDKRFKLWADTETIYVAEFIDGAWDCGLDKDSLINRFHTL